VVADPDYYPSFTIGSWQTGVIDTNGVRWWASSPDYADGPGVRLNQTDKPFADGAFRIRSFRASRTITIQGGVECPDRYSAVQAANTLKALFPAGGQQSMLVDDGIATRTCTVELAANPKVSFMGPVSFDFQLPLSAVDPRMYDTATLTGATTLPTPGATGLNWSPSASAGLNWAPSATGGLDWGSVSSNGALAMANPGTASTWPTFTLVGPLINPVITDIATGRTLAYNGTLVTSSDYLVINCNPFNRGVKLQGQIDRFPLMTSANWMEIDAGGSLTVALSGAGSGQLQASWNAAYW
jgi:hypothetical protein